MSGIRSFSLVPGWYDFEFDGVRQAYEIAGSGAVCVVHSGGPGINSDYLRMPLLEQHLTMVYLDPIGTGRSDLLPGGDYSVSTYARFSKAVIDHLGADQPYFLGHSHGGFVGLELAIRNPGLLAGLVAYSTAPVYNAELFEEATREMEAFVARWPDQPDAEKARRAWRSASYARNTLLVDRESRIDWLRAILPAYFGDYWKTVARTGPAAFDVTWDPARKDSDWDARRTLDRIDVPTLVISGLYDVICSRRFSEEIHAGVPNAQMLQLNQSGHFGYLEQPDIFVQAIVEFTR
ncbi:alpha/beta fold hydrolase [Pseudonocardia sp. CA-142604]|uniref:alpha/beta fold hydrolase n=1 Tax=Pseudonocardia sp. CA-142604 TaxID=3240024 RepID=UPI003D8D6796